MHYTTFTSFRIRAPFSYRETLKEAACRSGGWCEEEYAWLLNPQAFGWVMNKLGSDVTITPPSEKIKCRRPIGTHKVRLCVRSEEVCGGRALHVLAMSGETVIARVSRLQSFNYALINAGASRINIEAIAKSKGVNAYCDYEYDFDGVVGSIVSAIESNLPVPAKKAGWAVEMESKESVFRFLHGLAASASTKRILYSVDFGATEGKKRTSF